MSKYPVEHMEYNELIALLHDTCGYDEVTEELFDEIEKRLPKNRIRGCADCKHRHIPPPKKPCECCGNFAPEPVIVTDSVQWDQPASYRCNLDGGYHATCDKWEHDEDKAMLPPTRYYTARY